MKDQAFRTFYQTELLPHLTRIEAVRKKLLWIYRISKYMISIINLFFFIFILPHSFDSVSENESYLRLMSVMFISVLLISSFILMIFALPQFLELKMRKDFKINIMRPVIDFINPGLIYEPDRHITLKSFKDSGLIDDKDFDFTGDDLIRGKIGLTSFVLSEINCIKHSRKRHLYTQIFHGLCFIADFSKKFKTSVYVIPENPLIINYVRKSGTLSTHPMIMDDPEFNNIFHVYGVDEIETRYILSNSLMERIKNYYHSHECELYLSFRNNRIYILISYTRDLFEPKLFSSMSDYSFIEDYYRDLRTGLDLVNDLNLNLRIWG
jgi:hypothetical protein